MRKKVIFIGLVCAMSLVCFTGCSDSNHNEKNTTEMEQSETTEEATIEGVVTEEVVTEEVATEVQLRDLSAQEIKEFESLLNSMEYNGFVTIQFQDPTEIEWDMVCYNGAGIQMDSMSKEQGAAFLKAANIEEFYTDVTAIAASDMEAFVERTTGTKYADAKKPLTWTYVEDYDFYAGMHGDTNYLGVSDISGQCEGDVYTIRYSLQGFLGEMENHVLTLKKNGEQYLFLSNVLEDAIEKASGR